jgi:hypothetical protein
MQRHQLFKKYVFMYRQGERVDLKPQMSTGITTNVDRSTGIPATATKLYVTQLGGATTSGDGKIREIDITGMF